LNIIINPLSLIVFPGSNFDCDADSNFDSIAFICEKGGVASSALQISASTSVSVFKKFPARTPFK